MTTLALVADALGPIVFAIVLGFTAGRIGILKSESSGVLTTLVLTFFLPALLFKATATTSTAQLTDWRLFLGIALGMLVLFAVAFVLYRTTFHKSAAASALQAFLSSFGSLSLVGVPVLVAVAGQGAVLSVVFGMLISSLIQGPITLTLLEAGRSGRKGQKGIALMARSLRHAVKQPLVWAPLAGIAMAIAHIPLPVAAQQCFGLIGEASSGTALFGTGLLLSGQKLRINMPVVVNVALKNVVQPAGMGLIAVLLGLTVLHRQEMILLGAIPTAVTPTMLAVQYGVDADEAEATILLSTLLSVVTLGAIIALIR